MAISRADRWDVRLCPKGGRGNNRHEAMAEFSGVFSAGINSPGLDHPWRNNQVACRWERGWKAVGIQELWQRASAMRGRIVRHQRRTPGALANNCHEFVGRHLWDGG